LNPINVTWFAQSVKTEIFLVEAFTLRFVCWQAVLGRQVLHESAAQSQHEKRCPMAGKDPLLFILQLLYSNVMSGSAGRDDPQAARRTETGTSPRRRPQVSEASFDFRHVIIPMEVWGDQDVIHCDKGGRRRRPSLSSFLKVFGLCDLFVSLLDIGGLCKMDHAISVIWALDADFTEVGL